MVTMPVPGPGQQGSPQKPDRTVAVYVAGLMLLGLAGLIVVGVIVGKQHLEF